MEKIVTIKRVEDDKKNMLYYFKLNYYFSYFTISTYLNYLIIISTIQLISNFKKVLLNICLTHFLYNDAQQFNLRF